MKIKQLMLLSVICIGLIPLASQAADRDPSALALGPGVSDTGILEQLSPTLSATEIGLFNTGEDDSSPSLCTTDAKDGKCQTWTTVYRFDGSVSFKFKPYDGSSPWLNTTGSLGRFIVQLSSDNKTWNSIGAIVEPLAVQDAKEQDNYHVDFNFYLKFDWNKANLATATYHATQKDTGSPVKFVRVCASNTDNTTQRCSAPIDLTKDGEPYNDSGAYTDNSGVHALSSSGSSDLLRKYKTFSLNEVNQFKVVSNGLEQGPMNFQGTGALATNSNENMDLDNFVYQHMYFTDGVHKLIDNINHTDCKGSDCANSPFANNGTQASKDYGIQVVQIPSAFVAQPVIPSLLFNLMSTENQRFANQYYLSTSQADSDGAVNMNAIIAFCNNTSATQDKPGSQNEKNTFSTASVTYQCFASEKNISPNRFQRVINHFNKVTLTPSYTGSQSAYLVHATETVKPPLGTTIADTKTKFIYHLPATNSYAEVNYFYAFLPIQSYHPDSYKTYNGLLEITYSKRFTYTYDQKAISQDPIDLFDTHGNRCLIKFSITDLNTDPRDLSCESEFSTPAR